MLITIQRGATEEAQQELNCYVQAFQCMTITEDAHTVTLWTFDTDAAPVFQAMEYNSVISIMDPQQSINAIMEA